MLKIDLGCGRCKQEGFLGVDRFPLENVDVVANFDDSLPFETDSVDLLYASHSLEHVKDLMATMREVYRICKHGAQVCIVAPYSEQKLNLANPYHLCVFNEHTPRFWTDCPDALIDSAEYRHPHAPHWGLSRSDHSNPGLDLRLVSMEFFYFPEYINLSVERQRELRSARLDVCDQIMYHLVVWKEEGRCPVRSFSDYIVAFQPFEPEYVRQRKATNQKELLQAIVIERDELQSQLLELQRLLAVNKDMSLVTSNSTRRVTELEADIDNLERHIAEMRNENHQLKMQWAGAFEKTEHLNDKLQATRIALVKLQAESTTLIEKVSSLSQENLVLQEQVLSLNESCHAAQNELVRANSATSLLKVELEASNGLLAWYQHEGSSRNLEESSVNVELVEEARLRNCCEVGNSVVDQLYAQLSAHRSSRVARVFSILRRKDQLWELVSPAFAEIKSYTAQHFKKSSGVRLILGDDLRTMLYREYVIPFNFDSLRKVSLAICPLLPASKGTVGVEIVSSDQRVVVQLSVALSDIQPAIPTDFVMPAPLVGLGDSWLLRVFVENADVPVALYELVKYSPIRRRVDFSPFIFLQ